MTTYYLHTISGHPAFYDPGEQICYATFYGKAAPVAKSLRQIRREQQASIRWRVAQGLNEDGSDYGYVRVSLPTD